MSDEAPTSLILAIFIVHILILLGYCHLAIANRNVFAELIVSQSREFGVNVSREDILRYIDICLITFAIAIIVEIILSLRIICSKSEVIKR